MRQMSEKMKACISSVEGQKGVIKLLSLFNDVLLRPRRSLSLCNVTMSMAIMPFWFSMEHFNIINTIWLSTDNIIPESRVNSDNFCNETLIKAPKILFILALLITNVKKVSSGWDQAFYWIMNIFFWVVMNHLLPEFSILPWAHWNTQIMLGLGEENQQWINSFVCVCGWGGGGGEVVVLTEHILAFSHFENITLTKK